MMGSKSRMQGKEASEQETKGKSNAGIDVSKSWLDAHVLPAGATLRVANTREGIRKLKRWLMPFDVALVVIEATGKWHRDVRRSLHAAMVPVALVDPFRVRMFAKACGVLAKTDRLDARVLAQFAAVMAPAVRAPASEVMEELAELVTARASAVAEQTALKNQLSTGHRHLPQAPARPPHPAPRQGHRRPRAGNPQMHSGRPRTGQTLCHPHLDHRLRSGRRHNPHRLSRRTRHLQPQADRHVGRPRPRR